jgi:hypothetical protein
MFFSPGNSAARGHSMFIFCGAGGVCNLKSLLHRLDALPRIRYFVASIDRAAEIVEQKAIGLAVFGITTAAVHDIDNAKRLEFAQRCWDLAPLDAVFHELPGCDD